MPAHGEQVVFVHKPVPLYPSVKLVGKFADISFCAVIEIKIGKTSQNTGHEQTGINRRKLDVFKPFAGAHIQKMIKKTFVTSNASLGIALRQFVKKPQALQDSFSCIFAGDVIIFDTYNIGSQAIPGCSNAAERFCRPAVGSLGADRIGRFPEKIESTTVKVGQAEFRQAVGLPDNLCLLLNFRIIAGNYSNDGKQEHE